MGPVQVETLLDFGVRGEEDVGPGRDEDELVAVPPRFRLPSPWSGQPRYFCWRSRRPGVGVC
jgi:hypothetical protein